MTGFVSISRIAEVGFPDKVCPVVFASGCNLRCPYCLNVGVVEPKLGSRFLSIDDIIKQLDEWGEDELVISGGEPCQDDAIFPIIDALIARGKKVGVATNGTYPSVLADLIGYRRVNFIGLDCKFSPMVSSPADIVKKASVISGHYDPVAATLGIQGSLEVLQNWHNSDPQNARSEVRTTLYPPLVGGGDIAEIATLVHPLSRFVLQQYRQNKKFDGTQNEVVPYNEDEVADLLAIAKKNCKAEVSMRWP